MFAIVKHRTKQAITSQIMEPARKLSKMNTGQDSKSVGTVQCSKVTLILVVERLMH
jgi:hypothetical protein